MHGCTYDRHRDQGQLDDEQSDSYFAERIISTVDQVAT